MDITVIALCLGHESIETTHGYVEADLEMKQRALEKLTPATAPVSRFKAGDSLLQFLSKLSTPLNPAGTLHRSCPPERHKRSLRACGNDRKGRIYAEGLGKVFRPPPGRRTCRRRGSARMAGRIIPTVGFLCRAFYACFSQIAESTRNNFGAGLTTNDPDFLTASNR